MKQLFTLFLFLFSIHCFAQVTPVVEKDLNIAIGIDETVQFDYKFNTKVQIGNESLLQLILSPSKREITFRGIKAGKTSVTIRDSVGDIREKYIVNITSDGNSNTVRELRELIGEVEGLKIGIKGGRVVVEGEIIVPSKIGKVTAVLSQYPDVIVLVEYSQQTQLLVAREMQDAINKNNMKDVTVRVVNGDYWLEGVVNSEGKKVLAENFAKAYLPDKLKGLGQSAGGPRFEGKVRGTILNFVSVNEKKDPEPPSKMIQISAQFVELSKDYNKVFAFKWAPFMSTDSSISFGKTSNGGITTDESGTLSGTISRLFPKLNSAKQAGYARVIQSGMVVVSDGKSASISKSREINYAVGTGDFSKPASTKISFNMSVVPRVGAEETIKLEGLSINVSLPGPADNDGNPTSTDNSIKTEIVVKAKESAVVGGIVQSSSSTDYDKNDPDAKTASEEGDDSSAQASSLFNLLRSKSYVTSKSQFVVFVTPEILESASKGSEEIRKKFRKRDR